MGKSKGIEAQLQSDMMDLLLVHPRIAWAMAVTTGVFKVKGGAITTGHYISDNQKRKTGMSDIIGMFKTGQFFSIEVKKPKEVPTPEQFEFMDMVNKNGGFAIWANSIESISVALKT